MVAQLGDKLTPSMRMVLPDSGFNTTYTTVGAMECQIWCVSFRVYFFFIVNPDNNLLSNERRQCHALSPFECQHYWYIRISSVSFVSYLN